jgi:hypothetical protein
MEESAVSTVLGILKFRRFRPWPDISYIEACSHHESDGYDAPLEAWLIFLLLGIGSILFELHDTMMMMMMKQEKEEQGVFILMG